MIPQDHYESTILCSHASVPSRSRVLRHPKDVHLISNDRLLLVALTGQTVITAPIAILVDALSFLWSAMRPDAIRHGESASQAHGL